MFHAANLAGFFLFVCSFNVNQVLTLVESTQWAYVHFEVT